MSSELSPQPAVRNRLPQGPKTALAFFYNSLFKKNYTAWNFLEANRQKYGDIARMPLPFAPPMYQVTDPDLIGKILMGTEKTNRKSIFFERMKRVGGNGLILSGGETWRVNRKLANPAFHPRMIDHMRTVIDEEVTEMIADWEKKIAVDPLINISAEMSKLLLNVIVRILFTTDFKDKSDVITDAMTAFQEYSTYIYYVPFDIPFWVPTPMHRKIKRVIRIFDEITFEVIDKHRKNPELYQDLLSVYLASVDEETGAGMSNRQLRDEVLTLILAGHETTAASLAMGFHALSQEPEATDKIIHEDKDSHAYVNLVQQEILRLYPAIWSISRELTEPLAFKGVNYPVGSTFLLVQQLMHRHPDHWPRPTEFWPERFLAEHSQGRHPFAYFPFGGGVRNCIGMGLAKLEMNITLSRFLRAFKMEPDPSHTHRLTPQFTTTPLPFVALRVSKR
ncbi:MAG: cytochrome P450 [Bdellovibrionota bacterium]